MRYPILLSALLLAPWAMTPAIGQDASAADDLPFTCGYLCVDGVPLSTDTETPPETALVTQIYLGTYAEACKWAVDGGPSLYEPKTYDFKFRPVYIEDDEPDRDLRLYRYFCGSGAYNQRHVYLVWTADSGVQPVSFAQPEVTYESTGEDSNTTLTSLTMTGMGATRELVNSKFDPETRTLTAWSCWRGLCDASSRGEWRLAGSAFELVTYDYDPTYDGEVNLFRVVDYTDPSPVDISEPLPFEPPMLDEEELD